MSTVSVSTVGMSTVGMSTVTVRMCHETFSGASGRSSEQSHEHVVRFRSRGPVLGECTLA